MKLRKKVVRLVGGILCLSLGAMSAVVGTGWWFGEPSRPMVRIATFDAGDLKVSEPNSIQLKTHPFLRADFHESLDSETMSESTRNSRLRLWTNGESLPPLLQMIADAKQFIFINVLSLDCDDSTAPLFRDLQRRAGAGLDVRLIINSMSAKLSGSCLQGLEAAGVRVLKVKAHASYIVTDQRELWIGSQSLARFFFKSDGENGLDRDQMLQIGGPVATDAVQNFLSIWEDEFEGDGFVPSKWTEWISSRRGEEFLAGTRGVAAVKSGLAKGGLCRFVSQKPDGRGDGFRQMILRLIEATQERVILRGVKLQVDDSGELGELERASATSARAGVRWDFIGNGPAGGNGELRMLLDEWIAQGEVGGAWIWPRVLRGWRELDRARLAKKQAEVARDWSDVPNRWAWAHSQFVHDKTWTFDGRAVWVGSANWAQESFERFHEAGVLCFDGKLAAEMATQNEKDLSRSQVIGRPAVPSL